MRIGIAASLALLAFFGATSTQAGFRSPESLVRNVYAYYGDRTSALSSGLPHDTETAQQFFDASLREAWLGRSSAPYDFLVQSATWKGKPVTMNFILVKDPDGWVIYDVESPHDSLRAFLAQYRN
jgi:hypothetical protein